MKYLKLFEECLEDDLDIRKRILNEYRYKVENENIINTFIRHIKEPEADIIKYLTDNNKLFNIKVDLRGIADVIVNGVIDVDIQEFIAEEKYISYLFDKIPSTTTHKIAEFVEDLINTKSGSKNIEPLFELVYEVIAPEIFKEIENDIYEKIIYNINKESTYFSNVKNLLNMKYIPKELTQKLVDKINKKYPELYRGIKSGLFDLKK